MSDSIPASGPLPRPQESGSSGDKGHGIAPIVLDSESDWQSDWDSDSDTDGDMDVEMADATGQKGEGHEADEGDEVDAPFYNVPARPLGAVEAPALISDVDRGMKAFGNVYSYDQFMDPNRNSIPFNLNPDDPFLNPVVSHNASAHNIVLKITVPKRTGRRRKKGSDGPWEGEVRKSQPAPSEPPEDQRERIYSQLRMDHPKTLRRKLQDNPDSYQVEPLGVIQHTHRYRGMADFYVSPSMSKFTQHFMETVMTGDREKMKQFKLNPGMDTGPGADIIPPPHLTHMALPYNYQYEQNPFVKLANSHGAGGHETINTTVPEKLTKFLSSKDPTPQAPLQAPNFLDPTTAEVINALEDCSRDRPIWTRRALLNHLSRPESLGPKLATWAVLKKYIPYQFYQIRGGPFRDALIPFGLDPRKDPQYRIYQTLEFKLPSGRGPNDKNWREYRRKQAREQYATAGGQVFSHIFDGTSYYEDGKVWQVCDIADPLLAKILHDARVRSEFDVEGSGWYHYGTWEVVKAVMKYKLVALCFGKEIQDGAFKEVLDADDGSPPPGQTVTLHMPDLGLTAEEQKLARGKRIHGWAKKLKRRQHGGGGVTVRIYGAKGKGGADEKKKGKEVDDRGAVEELMSLAEGSSGMSDGFGEDGYDESGEEEGEEAPADPRLFGANGDEEMEGYEDEYGDEGDEDDQLDDGEIGDGSSMEGSSMIEDLPDEDGAMDIETPPQARPSRSTL